MSYQIVDNVKVWGDPDLSAVSQMKTCMDHGDVFDVALMGDHHKGYSQPIGGVVAYRNAISPSGVGYDIACGNKAALIDANAQEVRRNIASLMDEVFDTVSFGIGRKNPEPVEHPIFQESTWDNIEEICHLKDLAQGQLGTVGSGNHYVDIFVEEGTECIWIGCHFGSRGLGHKIASGFLNLANGREFNDRSPGESMDQPPTLISMDSELGKKYFQAMELAGRYAYAGRDWVIQRVASILGGRILKEVHNHHNFAWMESHGGEIVFVVRKGATPCFPGQESFVGGSMADVSVILEGIESQEAHDALYSTVHGAGRIMSRTEAAGKVQYKVKGRPRIGGKISPAMMHNAVREFGVELRGAGTDESPFVYRKLADVLGAHGDSIEIKHVLRPIGVAMAGANEFDPYKD